MSHPDLLFSSTGAMVRVLAACALYAPTDYSVLLLGPPGSGKTTLARHMHQLSGRPGAFVACSLAGIPADLEQSYLAGHRRGAFTGAYADQVGRIEAAHQGTLFLDELGLASGTGQGILLELLGAGTLCRLGETRHLPVNVRFLAATNEDLDARAKSGTFRRDLLGRFGDLRIKLPPLRERQDEILPLAAHYLAVESTHVKRDAQPVLSPSVRDCFLAAPWDDNIRELRSVCRYVVLHTPRDREVEMCDLPLRFLATLGPLGEVRGTKSSWEQAHAAVRRAQGNKAQAARELGVSRRHLYRLLGGGPAQSA